MKKLILSLVLLFAITSSMNANNDITIKESNLYKNTNVINKFISSELFKEIDYSCTLTAEVSYGGATVKFSITEDTCEKAGAGIAQATKGFIKEMKE